MLNDEFNINQLKKRPKKQKLTHVNIWNQWLWL
jgi:hypothetical protein